MKLNLSTDYAIRIILYLTRRSEVVSSTELSGVFGIPQRYLLQVSAKLRDSGVLKVSYDPAGGFLLAKKPEELSIYDVINTLERGLE